MTDDQQTPNAVDDEEEKRKKRRAAGWLWWTRYNRASSGHDWFTWLFSGGPAPTAVAVVTAGAVATAGVVGYNYATQAPPEAPPAIAALEAEPPKEPLEKAPEQASDTSILFPIEGRDKAGRLGKFDVVVLTKKYGWVRKSTVELTRDGETLAGPDVLANIFDEQVRDSFGKAKAVIAAGVASQEGDATVETERANQRAKQSAQWLVPVVSPEMPIWTLNLGQYKQPCPDCATSGTDWQRPLIVVAVRDTEPDTNIGEALADALRGKTNLPSPESYSAYTLTKFR